MNRRFLPAFLVCALLLAVLILFEYGKSFSFYFVGDDFAFIEYVLAEKAGIFFKPSCFYHYYPLGLVFIVFPAIFNVFEPEYFVAVNFLFFFLCSIMILLLYRKIAGGLLGGFFAAILFATAVPNSEVIYWKTTTSTIVMTFFSLLALAFYIRFLERKSAASLFASVLAFLASILCMEQGVVTFGILFLYDLIFFSFPRFASLKADRKRIVYGFLRRNFFLVLIPVSMIFIKSRLGAQLSAFPLLQLYRQIPNLTPKTLIRLFDFNYLSSGFLSSDIHIWPVVAAVVLVFSAYLFFKRTAIGLFFLLASTGPALTISFAAGGPNERYFCLPLVFFTCFLSLFIRDVAAAFIRLLGKLKKQNVSRNLMQKVHIAFYAAVCLAIAIAGFRGNLKRRSFWEAASRIERNIVGQVENIYLTGSFSSAGGRKIYLLNMPAYMVTRTNSIFYICSNSLIPDLRRRLLNADNEIELAATGQLFQMKLNNEQVLYRALGRDNMLDRKHVRKLINEGNLVLQFSPHLMTVVPFERM
jgi:hypothetical protein